jgi:hypothetical protein
LRRNLQEELRKLHSQGDPLVDQFVASIIDFNEIENSFIRLNGLMSLFKKLETNQSLILPQNLDSFVQLGMGSRELLQEFLTKISAPPIDFDNEKVKVAERLFKDEGYLSSLVFLFASLPEVYIMPDISSVLHVTGHLEKIAEQRIRSTATMVLAVLLEGGILSPDGVGVILTLRARIIHSIIRVLLVRNNPQNLRQPYTQVLKIKDQKKQRHLFDVVYQNGWDFEQSNIPCNQLELLYTLLTFSFIYLRSLKRLNLEVPIDDQDAYLAIWNIVGHFMGIEEHFFPKSYLQAEFLFNEIQKQAYEDKRFAEFQKKLVHALMDPLEKSISNPFVRPLVRFLARYLTSAQSSHSLQLLKPWQVPFYSFFYVGLKTFIFFDKALIKIFPRLVLMKNLCRRVSLAIIKNILMNDQQPINLPVNQKVQIERLLRIWNKGAI